MMDELLYGTFHSISIQQQQQQQQEEEEEEQPAPGNNHMVSWGSYQIQNNYNNNNSNNNDITSNYISTAPVVAFGDEHGTGNIPVVYGSDHMGSGNSSSGISSSSDAAASSLLMVAEIRRNNSEEEVSSAIRAKIASHPLYPKLMEAYIDCQKVGAPPELAHVLDEIRREGDVSNKNSVVSSCCWGDDPELDEFMETYCDILVKYKSDLSKPFNEASSFLDNMETQLSNLCNGFSRSYVSDEAGGSSEEDLSGGETEVPECSRPPPLPPVDREIKDKLISKYGGYIRTLKLAFSKKKKKGKLPKEARQILLDWWNLHYNWPYPTEADKVALAESTGLDQRQINNWFINQRKRHWKPSENMQFNLMDGLYGPYFHE